MNDLEGRQVVGLDQRTPTDMGIVSHALEGLADIEEAPHLGDKGKDHYWMS